MKKCVFFQWIVQIAVAALAAALLPGPALARGGPAMFMAGLLHFYAIMFYLNLGTGAAAMLVGYRFRHSLWQALLAGVLFGMVAELCLLLILGWFATRLYFEMLWYVAVLSAFGAGFVAVSHRFRHSLWQTTLAELCLVLVMALLTRLYHNVGSLQLLFASLYDGRGADFCSYLGDVIRDYPKSLLIFTIFGIVCAGLMVAARCLGLYFRKGNAEQASNDPAVDEERKNPEGKL